MTFARAMRATVIAAVVWLGPSIARADAVLDWNRIMQTTLAVQNPFAMARSAAITQLAVFEAVNAIDRRYEPYLNVVSAPATASTDAAAIAAAHRALRTLVPAAAATLDAARAQSLAAIPDSTSKDAGIAAGEAAAAAIIALRANDGSTPPRFFLPSSAAPGEWQTTPGCPAAGGILVHWGQVTPFGVPSVEPFRSDPPPALTSKTYTRDFNEVKGVGDVNSTSRPQDRADVARFYNAVLAVAVWNDVARQLAVAAGHPLTRNARTFAVLAMAINDGLVAVMDTKYQYTFWRPETAIHDADADGNPDTTPDPAFRPFITAPCFPGYPSAHAAGSYAARGVLQRIFGNEGHMVTLVSAAVPNVQLSYSTLKSITADIDDARVYGGIHFRFDQRAGGRLGGRIAAYVHAHQLRPIDDDDEGDDEGEETGRNRDDHDGWEGARGRR